MRPIKFRGHDRRGNVFYGTYNQDMGAIDDWEYAATYAIDADAEQCCGCDCDNSEVYENDILLDEFGKEFTAELRPVAVRKTPSHKNVKGGKQMKVDGINLFSFAVPT